MRTARGSRTCAQIGSAGRGGASTALIASGSAARQKTRAQTDPRTRRGRFRVLRGARRHSTQDSAPREPRGGRHALPAHARPLYGRRCAAGRLSRQRGVFLLACDAARAARSAAHDCRVHHAEETSNGAQRQRVRRLRPRSHKAATMPFRGRVPRLGHSTSQLVVRFVETASTRV